MNAYNNNAEQQAMNNNLNNGPRWARVAAKICNPIFRISKPVLFITVVVVAAIIGLIVTFEFAKLFSQVALTISSTSVQSTEGSILVFSVYCTTLYVYFQWIPQAYKRFHEIINSFNIEKV